MLSALPRPVGTSVSFGLLSQIYNILFPWAVFVLQLFTSSIPALFGQYPAVFLECHFPQQPVLMNQWWMTCLQMTYLCSTEHITSSIFCCHSLLLNEIRYHTAIHCYNFLCQPKLMDSRQHWPALTCLVSVESIRVADYLHGTDNSIPMGDVQGWNLGKIRH